VTAGAGGSAGGGGGVTIAGGNSPGSVAGGDVTATGGTSGTGKPGHMKISTSRGAAAVPATVTNAPVLTLEQTGASGALVTMFAGTDDPSSLTGVTANEGSLYMRDAGATGFLYLKTGALATDWTAVATGTGSGTLQNSYDNGQTIAITGSGSVAISQAVAANAIVPLTVTSNSTSTATAAMIIQTVAGSVGTKGLLIGNGGDDTGLKVANSSTTGAGIESTATAATTSHTLSMTLASGSTGIGARIAQDGVSATSVGVAVLIGQSAAASAQGMLVNYGTTASTGDAYKANQSGAGAGFLANMTGASAGTGVSVSMGATTTGFGIVSNTTAGSTADAVRIHNSGDGDALHVKDSGNDVLVINQFGSFVVTAQATATVGSVASITAGPAGAATFAGGDVALTGGLGLTTGIGGDVTATGGTSGTGKAGHMKITTTRTANGTGATDGPAVTFTEAAGQASVWVGATSPNGTVTGTRGSLYLKNDDGTAYINTNNATAWTAVATGTGAGTLQTAYDNATPTINLDASGGIRFLQADAAAVGAATLEVTNDEDSVGNNTLTVTRAPAASSTAGHGVSVVMGANASGSGLFANNLGTGNLVQFQDNSVDVFKITSAGTVTIEPTTGFDFNVLPLTTGQMTLISRNGAAAFGTLTVGAQALAGNVLVGSSSSGSGGISGDCYFGTYGASPATSGGTMVYAGLPITPAPGAGELIIKSAAAMSLAGSTFTASTTTGTINITSVAAAAVGGQVNVVTTATTGTAGNTAIGSVATGAAGVSGDIAITTFTTNATGVSGDILMYTLATVGGGVNGGVAVAAGFVPATPAAGEITYKAANDIKFTAQGGTAIPFNANGADSNLVGFTATSIVGALNELKVGTTAASQIVQTGFDTTTNLVTSGQLGYLTTTANRVQKGIATSLAASLVFGANEGTSGKMTTEGTIEAMKAEPGITIAAGDRLFLSAVSAGTATNVAPSTVTQVVVPVGYARTAGTGGTLAGAMAVTDTFSAGPTQTLSVAGAFVAGDVGRTIKITGATSAGNNGYFVITSVVAGTSATYTNAGAVAENALITTTYDISAATDMLLKIGSPVVL
jgi:hypothetical protein